MQLSHWDDDFKLSNQHHPIEDVLEETAPLNTNKAKMPSFDPDAIERKVEDPTQASNFTPNNFTPNIEEVEVTLEFVHELQQATLDRASKPIDYDLLYHICNSPFGPIHFTYDKHLSINLYSAINNASKQTFNNISHAMVDCHLAQCFHFTRWRHS